MLKKKRPSPAGLSGFPGLLLLLPCLLVPFSAQAEMRIHFMDVGQGDAILVQCGDASMLVDAGPAEAGQAVNRYLTQNLCLTALDYVVATHEHDDHLYGMPDALAGLEVRRVYAPPSVPMTYWLTEVLPRLARQDLQLLKPAENETVPLGEATVTFLNTQSSAENPNDRSLVLLIRYGNTSALLTGDIEGDAETALVNSGAPLKADVLKVTHHGGNTSSSKIFLNAVDPDYAVISVGAGNRHGHPHAEPLRNFERKNITVYRTDLFGTVIGTSNGESWEFEVLKAR